MLLNPMMEKSGSTASMVDLIGWTSSSNAGRAAIYHLCTQYVRYVGGSGSVRRVGLDFRDASGTSLYSTGWISDFPAGQIYHAPAGTAIVRVDIIASSDYSDRRFEIA